MTITRQVFKSVVAGIFAFYSFAAVAQDAAPDGPILFTNVDEGAALNK